MPVSRVVAIDHGAGHVACGVFAVGRGGRLRLQRFAVDAFNPDVAHEATWADSVALSLQSLAEREGLRGAAHVALAGHHILAKTVKTPKVEDSKREKILGFEAQQAIPFPLEEVVWDHLTIAEDGLDIEVLLAAVKVEVVERVCAAVADAGLRAQSALPSVLALYRAFCYNHPEASEHVMVADIGARSTNLLFIDGKRLALRTIPLAGNTITQVVADEIRQDFAHAEALKLQVLSGRSDLPSTSPSRAVVQQAAQTFVGRLTLEITRSLVNYRRQTGAGQPVALYLTGGGSLLPELGTQLAERLKLRVETFDPLRAVDLGDLDVEARAQQAFLANVVGTAVAAAGSGAAMNLLPRGVRTALEFRRRQPWLLGAAAAAALAIAPPLWHFQTLHAATVAKTREIEAQLVPLRRIQTRNAENLARIEETRKQIAAIEGLARTRANWIEFFSDLQTRLGKVEDVWLEKLQVIRAEDATVPAAPTANVEAGGDGAKAHPAIRLNVTGRLLDRQNPVSKVSTESFNRVKTLLGSFKESRFIADVENERFDNTQPGVLRFDFILVINPANPL